MTPITTSAACARPAIGASAATAVAPSNTLRRVIVIAKSPVDLVLSLKRQTLAVKPQWTAKAASKHGKLLVLQIGHQHQARCMRDRKRQLGGRDHRLRRHPAGPEH